MPRSYGSVSLVDSLKQQQLSSADGEFHLWCAQEGLLTQRGPDLLNLQAASPLAANRPATCEPPRLWVLCRVYFRPSPSRLADDRLFLRRAFADQIADHDQPGGDPDTHL